MREVTASTITLPEARLSLDEILRQGAQRLLAQTIETEVAQWIDEHQHVTDDRGRRRVVRNGYLPERKLVTAAGEVAVQQPRVRDRRPEEQREKFNSKLLQPYLRKTKSMEELIPYLHLKGVSTGDFQETLSALLGPDCPGLSATTITRLKSVWEQEYREWSSRLFGRQGVWVRVGGRHPRQHPLGRRSAMHPGANGRRERRPKGTDRHDRRLPGERPVLAGVALGCEASRFDDRSQAGCGRRSVRLLEGGRRSLSLDQGAALLGAQDGQRAGQAPQGEASPGPSDAPEIWMADTRRAANQAFDAFLETYQAKYPKATECLAKDREELLAFYDFPAEHWNHLRTTNPIESTFATIRLRHRRTTGSGSRLASLTMMFKPAESAARRRRLLDGHKLLPDVIRGVVFQDGLRLDQAAA